MEEKKLDVNSLIGFGLIFVILIYMFYINQPTPEELAAKQQAEREAAAIKIQARIRGKEERDHALKRKDIQNQHEEDEILTALTNSASGTDGKKIQNCFPRGKTKDVLIRDLLIKIGKIKSKDAAIVTLQALLENKKIIELLHRDFKRNDKKNNPVIMI